MLPEYSQAMSVDFIIIVLIGVYQKPHQFVDRVIKLCTVSLFMKCFLELLHMVPQ